MDAHMVNHILNRLNEAIGASPPPIRYVQVGEDSVDYLTMPYSEEEVLLLITSMIDRAHVEQDRRDRIIAWAEGELQIGGEDVQDG